MLAFVFQIWMLVLLQVQRVSLTKKLYSMEVRLSIDMKNILTSLPY